MVHKPERWAVNAAGVAPEWQWAWRDLRLLLPLWDLNVDVARLLGPVETNDWPGDHTTRITKVGLGIAQTDPDATYTTVFGTTENYQYWSDPWSATLLFNVAVQPVSDQPELFNWEGQAGFRFNQTLSTGLQYLGNSLDGPVNFGSGWPVPEWVLVCARSEGGDGTTNSVKLDAYILATGEHLWDTSAGWNYTGAGAKKFQFFRTATVNTVGELEFAIGMFWHRYLSDSEVQRLAADPFGPIRPRRLTPADVTNRGSVVVLKDNFTGTNGDLWNLSNWQSSAQNGVALPDIQTNRGRLYGRGGATGTGSRARGIVAPVHNVEVLLDATPQTYDAAENTNISVIIRGDGVWSGSFDNLFRNCYRVQLNITSSATFRTDAIVDGNFDAMTGTTALSGTPATWRIRFQAVDDYVRVKIWDASGSEPAAWSAEDYVGPGGTAGYLDRGVVGISNYKDSGTNARYWDIDNLTVKDLDHPVVSDPFRTKVFVP